MDIIDTIALTMGVGWASGLNLYAAILTLVYLGTTGHIVLPGRRAPRDAGSPPGG